MFASTKCELIKLPSSLQDHIDLFNQSTYLTYITFMSSSNSKKRECINTLPCGYKNNKKNRKSWKFWDESLVYSYICEITWNDVNNWLVVLYGDNRYDKQKNISFAIFNFDILSNICLSINAANDNLFHTEHILFNRYSYSYETTYLALQ